ncbi:hypothetical protein B0H10DRAFT_2242143 [Mycena sp. CBHHK59/15]|nr:hypothetical protein B0H10DRAFT_2242143 [Mycena sp. CBHHK59/15]
MAEHELGRGKPGHDRVVALISSATFFSHLIEIEDVGRVAAVVASFAIMLEEVKDVIKIFNVKYPNGVAVFVFDCSSAHEAYASDALLAHKMNRGPGGKQPRMRDTIIPSTGQPQAMVFPRFGPWGFREDIQNPDGRYILKPPNEWNNARLPRDHVVSAKKLMKQILSPRPVPARQVHESEMLKKNSQAVPRRNGFASESGVVSSLC